MTTTIKITELENIGASLASSTLIPVVNMSGTPTTEKAVLGNIANVILAGAGTTYVGVGAATLAGTVTTAAQPNITSVGTLTSLAINGTTTGVSFTANTGVFTGNGNGLSSLVGANVSGAVAFATTANAVAGANVSGAVTYATTANAVAGANVSGFVANATYANLATFATTANAVALANVSGAGNISSINIDGSNSNVLYGNGVFAAVAGGGANTGNVTFNNQIVLGTGSNDGSGGLYLAPGNASIANSAVQYLRVRGGDVATHIHLDTGNNAYYDQYFGADSRYVKLEANGNVVINADDYNGNGASWTLDTTGNLTLPDTTSVIANVSITLEANDTGNITGLNLIGDSNANLYAHGNVKIVSDSSNTIATWTFDTTGNLNTPGDIVGPSGANFTIYSNAAAHEFIFADDGTFYAPDDAVLGGNVYIGPGANTVLGLEHEVLVASSNHFPYIQAVVNNVSDNGSAEWVALGARGNDSGGWADMGFTSGGFNDANYTITGPGDGYVFVESYYDGQILGSRGGNLVLATGEQGTSNDIIFGTGGFLTSNIFGRISDANNSLELSRTGATITFPDATEQNTAWTGSVTRIANGTSNVNIPTSNGNVAINVGSNSWVFGTSGNLTLPGNTVAINFANGSSAFGNIVATNLDGNVSNLLTGNGTYVAIPVVPTVGNIATLNLDGNASNVLRGDGTFGADANSSYGDSNVVSLLSAFGSNTIVTTGIITADGANLSNVPYANLTGAPSLGNISNINLDGNVSNLLTGNGTYVAIPIVPTVGNIATINLDGSTSNVLFGNGVFAAVPAPTVSQDITSNGAMSIMTYDGNLKYVSYATVEPSSGNIAGGNISTTGAVSANYFAGNGGNITYQQTNTLYVDPLRTHNYTPSGTVLQPFFTVSAAISAAVSAGYTDSNPAVVLLLSNITENITMQPGIFLTSFGTGTHGSPTITGTITVSSSSGSISSNHYSISNLRLVAPSNGTCIDFTGSAAQRLFIRDVWLDTNGSGTCIFMDNANTTSVLHLNIGQLAHSGTGDIYCIDLTTGNAYLTDIETSGTMQVAAVRTGTVMTIDSSEIDANNDAAIEVYGGTLTVTNSIITNTKANSNGVALNTTGSVCTLLNVLFSIPTGTGKAVFGTTTSLLYYLNVAFAPGSNTGKTASPALIATVLGTTWS